MIIGKEMEIYTPVKQKETREIQFNEKFPPQNMQLIIFSPRPNKSADPPEVLLLLFVLAISNVALADDPEISY